MKTCIQRFLALLALLTAISIPARALQEFYSVPYGANATPTWGSSQAADFTARTYDSFQLSAEAMITRVSWTGCYIDETQVLGAPPVPLTTAWRIGFFAAGSGGPGVLVHTVDIPAGDVTSVFVSNETWSNGSPIVRRQYTANLPTPAFLQAGVTYWFSPVSLQPVFNPHFSWMAAADGAGDCLQLRNPPQESIVREGNRSFVLSGEPPPPPAPGISLSIGGNTIASGGSYVVGNVPLNATQGVVVRVRNNGTTALTGVTATMTAGTPVFSIGTAPPTTIAAGGEQNLVFNFTPPSTGTHTGTLQVTSTNGTPNPYIVQLSGGGLDNVAPVITTPAVFLSVVDGAGGISAAVNAWLANHGGAVATDNSGTVNWSHNYTGLPAVGASAVVTFTAMDPSGNTAATQANLNLLDQTPPEITAQAAPLTVACDAANKGDLVNAWLAAFGTAAATDNSGSVTWSHNFIGPVPGACGVINVTFSAKDPSNNQSTTQAALTIVDNTAPVLTTPAADLVVESNGSGNATQRNAWLTARGGAAATDNCGAVTWNHNFTGLANNLPQTVPVTFTATDSCGNISKTAANFIIQDTTPPQLTIPSADFYGDQSEAAVDLAAFLNTRGGAQAVDIAGPVTWSNNYAGTPPPVGGYITVTFTATDTVGLSVSTTCRFFLFPPGKVWIGPATGAWSVASNWRGFGGDYYVDLFDFQNTLSSLNVNTIVDDLYIGAGDEVILSNGADLTVAGGLIRNAGILRSRSTASTTGAHHIILSAPTSLEGPGKLIISGPHTQYLTFATGTAATSILTVGAGQEITATEGTVANYQRTAIYAGLINQGTISADGGGLTFYSQPKTNQALIRAINGGFLDMEVPVNNTGGTFFAGPGSSIRPQSIITGGTITGTGTLLVNTGAGLIGPMLLDAGLTTALDGGTTVLTGTITNNGLITFGAATGTGASYIRISGPVTLDGSGRVLIQNLGRRQLLANTNAATDILTIGAQQEITTDHRTDSNYQSSSLHAGIVNYGTITADQGQLSLYSQPKTNHNLIRAINGGFLNMEADVINTGATLFVGAASTAYLQSTLSGGTVTGTGRLLANSGATLAGPMLLDSGLTTALEGSATWLSGTITNNGLIAQGSATGTNSAIVRISGAVSLEGTGKWLLQNDGNRQILRSTSDAADILTIGAQQEITTDSRTGLNYQKAAIHAATVNYGTITANGGGLTIYAASKTNHGTMRAINGGYMDFVSVTVTNYNAATDTLTGGNWEVVSNGPVTTMDLTSMPVVALAAGTTVRLSGANAMLPQLSTLRTISGTLVLENGKTLATSGNMVIPGRLQYGLPADPNTTRLAVTGNVDFTGARIDITDLGLGTGNYLLATWTGSVTGTPVLGTLPQGSQHSLVLDPVAKTLRLQVFVTPPVNITTFTIVPGAGPNAGQDIVTLAGTGHPNANYVLQASDNLQTWTPVSGLLTSPTGAISFSLSQSPSLRRRYFRFLPQ